MGNEKRGLEKGRMGKGREISRRGIVSAGMIKTINSPIKRKALK